MGYRALSVPPGATGAEAEALLLPAVNHAVRLLARMPGARESDVDVAFVYGTGFPRYLGGPLWWAARLGLERVRVGLRGLGVPLAAALVEGAPATVAEVRTTKYVQWLQRQQQPGGATRQGAKL